jgi:hypothetical protein
MNQPTTPGRGVDLDWTNTWEHPPETGPAAFVADRRALDEYSSLWGDWVDPSQAPEALEAAIEQSVGVVAVSQHAWIVTDQIGMGSAMIPEQLSVCALHRFARYRTGEPNERTAPTFAESITDVVRELPCARWDDASDLARDIIIVSGLIPMLSGLPDDWERYVEIDLDKLGSDAAVAAGLDVSDDGEIRRRGAS